MYAEYYQEPTREARSDLQTRCLKLKESALWRAAPGPNPLAVRIRIQWGNPRCPHKQRLLLWAERLFLLVDCLTLGFCGLVYLEAGLYRAFLDPAI